MYSCYDRTPRCSPFFFSYSMLAKCKNNLNCENIAALWIHLRERYICSLTCYRLAFILIVCLSVHYTRLVFQCTCCVMSIILFVIKLFLLFIIVDLKSCASCVEIDPWNLNQSFILCTRSCAIEWMIACVCKMGYGWERHAASSSNNTFQKYFNLELMRIPISFFFILLKLV